MFVDKKPMDLLKLMEKEMNDLLVDFVRSFRDHSGEERTGTYLLSLLKAVRLWHALNGMQVTRKVKIGGSSARPFLKWLEKYLNQGLEPVQIYPKGNKAVI